MDNLDLIVAIAEIENGAKPSLVAKRNPEIADQILLHASVIDAKEEKGRSNTWSQEELDFLENNLGKIHTTQIAKKLGRTVDAVKIKQVREGLDAPSYLEGHVSAHDASVMIGSCGKSIRRWVEQGFLKGQDVFTKEKQFLMIPLVSLKRFVINPKHWCFWNPESIRDHHLRKLYLLKKERVREEEIWVSVGEAGRMLGLSDAQGRIINNRCRKGIIPHAFKWGNWYMPKYQIENLRLPKGKGASITWQPKSKQRALIILTSLGVTFQHISHMMKAGHPDSIRARTYTWRKKGGAFLAQKIQELGLEGTVIAESDDNKVGLHPELATRWHDHVYIKEVGRVVSKYVYGDKLTLDNGRLLYNLIRRWGIYYKAQLPDPATIDAIFPVNCNAINVLAASRFFGRNEDEVVREVIDRLRNRAITSGWPDPFADDIISQVNLPDKEIK